MIAEHVQQWVRDNEALDHVRLALVEVREHGGNSGVWIAP